MDHLNDAACTTSHLLMISASLCSSPASMSSPNVFGHECSPSITWAKPPCTTQIASRMKKERKEPSCPLQAIRSQGLACNHLRKATPLQGQLSYQRSKVCADKSQYAGPNAHNHDFSLPVTCAKPARTQDMPRTSGTDRLWPRDNTSSRQFTWPQNADCGILTRPWV